MLFAGSAASGKEIAAGENAFGDFAPVRLPNGALGQEAFVAFKQVFGGASHSNEIGGRFDFGWVEARKSERKFKPCEKPANPQWESRS